MKSSTGDQYEWCHQWSVYSDQSCTYPGRSITRSLSASLAGDHWLFQWRRKMSTFSSAAEPGVEVISVDSWQANRWNVTPCVKMSCRLNSRFIHMPTNWKSLLIHPIQVVGTITGVSKWIYTKESFWANFVSLLHKVKAQHCIVGNEGVRFQSVP